MNKIPNNCPICGGELAVTTLYCNSCDTTISGHFHPEVNPLGMLSKEQIQFILTFIRCEGRFNRMEEEMNLSYPTLRNRLNDIIRAMGYEPGKEDTSGILSEDERINVLDRLANGEISAEEAQLLLKGKRE